VEDCYSKEGCIWDDSLTFGGVSGLCKTGSCSSLSSEEICNSESNHNLCAFVAGSCAVNPCAKSDCEGDITAGCMLSGNGNCVVDECMRSVESECVADRRDTCVVVGHNEGVRCVVGECSVLEVNVDCKRNEDRCKVVKNVCVEDPCTSAGCESPACVKESEHCTYDECSKYTSSG
jgi:hypothetical protein